MERAKQYLDQYQKSPSLEDRASIMAQYQAFLQTLSTDEREKVRQFMQAQLQPAIKKTVETLDALTEQADMLLKNLVYR